MAKTAANTCECTKHLKRQTRCDDTGYGDYGYETETETGATCATDSDIWPEDYVCNGASPSVRMPHILQNRWLNP
ncbi:GD18119 [Drosophila simulans]|uniref:GD18119 n=1 Tax=Drosophila simulans TaxID=7240 RepID=B4QWR9_DROSI|nr:GD18119 [Drosophila simulans]